MNDKKNLSHTLSHTLYSPTVQILLIVVVELVTNVNTPKKVITSIISLEGVFHTLPLSNLMCMRGGRMNARPADANPPTNSKRLPKSVTVIYG